MKENHGESSGGGGNEEEAENAATPALSAALDTASSSRPTNHNSHDKTPLKSNRGSRSSGKSGTTTSRSTAIRRRKREGSASTTGGGGGGNGRRGSSQRHRHRSGRSIRAATIYPDAQTQDACYCGTGTADPGTDATTASTSISASEATPPTNLPHNQYEVVVRRRAVIKAEDMARIVEERQEKGNGDGDVDNNDDDDGSKSTSTSSAGGSGWGRGIPVIGGGYGGDQHSVAADSATVSSGSSSVQASSEASAGALRPSVDEARRMKLPGMPSLRGVYSDRQKFPDQHGTNVPTKMSEVSVIPEDAEGEHDGEATSVRQDEYVANPEEHQPPTTTRLMEEHDDDMAGDTSLGLKLTILGGHVIVQGLNSLADGRASPAQLTGMVRRGDVLVAIDGRSLVHLPIDKLVQALKPLSEAEGRSFPGSAALGIPPGLPFYRRSLRLRFSIGEGLPYLDRPKGRRRPTRPEQSSGEGGVGNSEGFLPPRDAEGIAADVFGVGQLLMVDQLSGMPMFGDEYHSQSAQSVPLATEVGEGDVHADTNSVSSDTTFGDDVTFDASSVTALQSSALAAKMYGLSAASAARLSREIARQIAQERRDERMKSTSLFYELNKGGSDLLRGTQGLALTPDSFFVDGDNNPSEQPLTWGEMMDLGRRAVVGAGTLLDGAMEADVAGGVEKQRRSDAIEEASSCVSYEDDDGQSSITMGDADSNYDWRHGTESGKQGFLGGGSKSLLRLAARDEVWRNQMMQRLLDAETTPEEEVSRHPPNEDSVAGTVGVPDVTGGDSGTVKGAQTGIESQLQSLFWGDKVTRMLQKTRGKPLALPPREIASTLFDLVSGIAVISEGVGGQTTFSSRLLQDHTLATQFVLSDALPAFLETFRPLQWQQRRVLWPIVQSGTGSDLESAMAGGDMTLSIASTSTGWGTPSQRKNLEEQIEDLELDVEIRAETCYLVTFYFTHKLLPQLKGTIPQVQSTNLWIRKSNSASCSPEEEKIIDFIKTFGAYLKLHTCLVCASDAGSKLVIRTLLDMARFDSRHREFFKLLSNKQAFLLYEPAMLSALLAHLRLLADGAAEDEQLQMLVPLMVSAFPDLRPWLVREALSAQDSKAGTNSGKRSSSMYYRYLSLLLDADEGIDAARFEEDLVEEWCNLLVSSVCNLESLGDDAAGSSITDSALLLKNFHAVASQPSNGVVMYFRNVPMLMDLSMTLRDHTLASELAGEIILSKEYNRDSSIIKRTIDHIREIFSSEINKGTLRERPSSTLIKAFISLLNLMASSESDTCRCAIRVPEELGRFLKECDTDPDTVIEKEEDLISLITEMAAPSDVLAVLSTWDKCDAAPAVVLPALRSCMLSAAMQQKERIELLRIRQTGKPARENSAAIQSLDNGTIYERMLRGDISINKR